MQLWRTTPDMSFCENQCWLTECWIELAFANGLAPGHSECILWITVETSTRIFARNRLLKLSQDFCIKICVLTISQVSEAHMSSRTVIQLTSPYLGKLPSRELGSLPLSSTKWRNLKHSQEDDFTTWGLCLQVSHFGYCRDRWYVLWNLAVYILC